MNVSEKAAYIKGLMEGMKLDTTTNEGKLLEKIIELLEDLSLSVLDLEDEAARINDYADELDSDLADLEQEIYGYDDDCDCDCCGDYDDEDCDCDCDCDCDEE
ncbi:hypothetical protein LJB90_02135 [Eubacteriales bacterium OttesenSCG-928-G02]|nr:hypothetical protein [Eubacteriales bacterium OttesenSCG-928-G02]